MYNRVLLVGRLTADPELKTTPSGVQVCTFRIAVERPFTSGGERKTDFFGIVAWRQTAEFIQKFFTKGRMIGVDGVLQTREYIDKEDVKRTAYEINATSVFFCDSYERKEQKENTTDIPFTKEEDLPF